MAVDVRPDPSLIGSVPKPPFAILPDVAEVFATRTKRFDFLAQTSRLGPYLSFLGALSSLEARLATELPPPRLFDSERMPDESAYRAPPIDREAVAKDPDLFGVLERLCEEAKSLSMPAPARLALDAVASCSDEERTWLCANVLSETIPEDSVAPHVFVAAAVQVYLARFAASLDAETLVPVRVGVCPACGGRPATSSVRGSPDIENIRYATCSGCATQWNEVRIKCLCCGSTKGINYRSAETVDATVKAETCTECSHWVKIFYQTKNPTLDPIADDVGSLGLDLLMRETEFRRGGFNPFLVGY